MRALPLLSLGTVLLLVSWGTAGALSGAPQFNDEDGSAFEDQPRTVEVQPGEGEFEIRSFGEEGDRIRVRFRADEGELRLDFLDPTNQTLEVQLELTFLSLLEVVPGEGCPPLPAGSFCWDTIQEVEWGDFVFEGPVVDELEDGYVLRVEYGLPETDFQLGITFWVFQAGGEVEGVRVRPTEVKFDLEVSLFPFESPEGTLALLLALKTEVEPESNFTGTQAELEAVSDRYGGFFRWAQTVTADGEEAAVFSAVLAAETELEAEGEFEVERTVVLRYPQADSLVHDPVVGVTRVPLLPPLPPPPNGDGQIPVADFQSLAYFLMVGVGALFVIATLLVRRVRG